eukprot:GFUD01112921.1.p1 GENE.GFUD01112921.1~~GFUD01112921.1.p1  ORF type:complete len:264 (+),score=72.67 GFUD01112921.1:67-858(+)
MWPESAPTHLQGFLRIELAHDIESYEIQLETDVHVRAIKASITIFPLSGKKFTLISPDSFKPVSAGETLQIFFHMTFSRAKTDMDEGIVSVRLAGMEQCDKVQDRDMATMVNSVSSSTITTIRILETISTTGSPTTASPILSSTQETSTSPTTKEITTRNKTRETTIGRTIGRTIGDTRNLPLPLSFILLLGIILASCILVILITISTVVFLGRRGSSRKEKKDLTNQEGKMMMWKDDSFESQRDENEYVDVADGHFYENDEE